jgi:pyruvate,orthophosphate dikinase
MSGDFGTLMKWADEVRTLKVRTNADTPRCQQARKFGAEGIGLCRTEHMFFADRILAVREMISPRRRGARTGSGQAAADAAQRLRRHLYEASWTACRSRSAARSAAARVPAHTDEDIEELAADHGHDRRRAQRDHREPARVQPDAGPPRLPPRVTYPEIAEMQTNAVIEAADQRQEASPDWPVTPRS